MIYLCRSGVGFNPDHVVRFYNKEREGRILLSIHLIDGCEIVVNDKEDIAWFYNAIRYKYPVELYGEINE